MAKRAEKEPTEAEKARGDRIKAARKRAGRTLQEVAIRFGVSVSTAGRWEAGSAPEKVSMVELAAFLGTTPQALDYGMPEDALVARESVGRYERTEVGAIGAPDDAMFSFGGDAPRDEREAAVLDLFEDAELDVQRGELPALREAVAGMSASLGRPQLVEMLRRWLRGWRQEKKHPIAPLKIDAKHMAKAIAKLESDAERAKLEKEGIKLLGANKRAKKIVR